MADETKTATATEAAVAPAAAQQAQQVQIAVDAQGMVSNYTNWYRVTGTPEELILDFGLNPEHGQMPTQPIKLTDRIVMSFFTAKRLLSHLQFAVSRHESFFGVLEIDFQKRVRGVPGQR